jgi:uncharacterized membrane protein
VAEVILHLVLFTPRASVDVDAQSRFADALERALTTIPSVVSYRIGRRIRFGAAYEAISATFEYCGVIEFADRHGLEVYLSHPAHVELGRLFYETSGDAFAGDFDAVASAPAAALRGWRSQ